MNKGHFKDSQVVKGITIGAVLIVIYLALNNVTGILDSISYLAGLVMPFIIGAVIAFVFNVPMKKDLTGCLTSVVRRSIPDL